MFIEIFQISVCQMSVDKRFYENVCDRTLFKPMTDLHSVLCLANILYIFETEPISHEKKYHQGCPGPPMHKVAHLSATIIA